MELVTLKDFSFSYPNTPRRALHEINLAVEEGEFILLCGPSGGGKSTLLENIKPALRRSGERSGKVLFDEIAVEHLTRLQAACDIGFVLQDVEAQLVTDSVRAELCFGLESLGFPPEVIRRRVAEMASFFGLGQLLSKKVNSLSGGEKQSVNLASVLALSPRLLLLDEPTSQLDPVAASAFIFMLARLNRELGLTVIIAEHRTEELFSLCHRIVYIEDGKAVFDGAPREAAFWMSARGEAGRRLLPSAAQIFGQELPVPLTVGEGRALLAVKTRGIPLPPVMPRVRHTEKMAAAAVRDVLFAYDGTEHLLMNGLDFTAYEGELTAVMGDNGSGKTTLLKLLCGLDRPRRGNVSLFGQRLKPGGAGGIAALLPQNTRALFSLDTIREELTETASSFGASDAAGRVSGLIRALGLEEVLDHHPFDVSEGERQRAALAKVLLARPRLLLLDEPTKALDPEAKERLALLLADIKSDGTTIIMASHDTDFCARFCDRCALLFDGRVACFDEPRGFFGGNVFYTTAANRIASVYSRLPVTCEEVRALCGKQGDAR